MDTKLIFYRSVEWLFLICLPIAVAFVILPAQNLLRKRVRWGAIGFIGLGCLLVGWVASLTDRNTLLMLVMCGGLVALGTSSFRLAQSFFHLRH